MKRIVSIVLTLTLLLSCVCFFVSAESEGYSGVYNGYNYYCYGQVTRTSCHIEMTYMDATARLRIDARYNYKDGYGNTHTASISLTGKTSLYDNPFPDNLASFVSLTPSYYINSRLILSFTLSA